MFPTGLLNTLRGAACSVCLAIVGLACGGDLSPLPIGLEFRDELPGQCPSDSCTAYGLECGAIVSVRAFDADSNPLNQNVPIVESCIEVDAADSICSLSDIGLDLGKLPARRIRIEVAVWSPEQIGEVCPSGPIFDLAGLPLSTFDPQPAFAGARVIDAGDQDLLAASVELSCFDDDPLGICGEGQTNIVARIDDLDTLLFAPPLATSNLRVSVGAPSPRSGSGGTIFVIDAEDDFDLELTRTVPVPQFSATVPTTFSSSACLQVLDITPQSTTAVTCAAVSQEGSDLELVGYLVNKSRVDLVLAALGESIFLSGGIIIGRVIDDTNQPTAGVTVTATTPIGDSAEILYPSSDFSTTNNIGPTSAHGFFVAISAPYGSRWTASHLDGRQQAAIPVTGLIDGKVTAIVLPLEAASSN